MNHFDYISERLLEFEVFSNAMRPRHLSLALSWDKKRGQK
jgi:hypothetical protein